jgi:Tol biopolymer transport system component/DNA-binding winged helix-turn-helix (wHTH) protein
MAGHNSSVFRFSGVEVRESELHIRRDGEVLPVEPKAFRVLVYLLRNPGRLIPKDELINAGWGDTAVTDNSVTRNIALLRRLLGDDPREPRYIETVSTVGYRFVCPLDGLEDAPAELEADHGPNVARLNGKPQEPSRERAFRMWLPICVALAMAVVAGAKYLLRPLPPPRVVSYRQITFDGGDKELAGTDGIRIYFDRDANMRRSVSYVLAAGGDSSELPIQIPYEISLEDVSPDGANLLVDTDEYGVRNDRPHWIVRATDGVPVRHLPDARMGSDAFSADGKSVVYCTQDGSIWRVGSDGTGAYKIAAVGGTCGEPAWSPDGARIRFDRDDRLWEISSNGSNLHRLLPDGTDPANQCCGRWTADGSLYVFSGSRKGSSGADIWALDERHASFRRPHLVPVPLTAPPMDWGGALPAKQGNTVFATGVIPRGELSRFDSKTHQFQPFVGGVSAQGATFSRDGRFLAYVTYPEGFLFKANHDGSNAVQITDGKIAVYQPAWSPDGTQIAFMNFPADRVELYIVAADGGSPRRLLPDDPDQEWNATWSPDGKEIAFYVSREDPSKSHIRVVNVATRQVRDLPGSMNMIGPVWSPDGRYIDAVTTNFFTTMLFEIRTQKWIPLLEKTYVAFPTWSSDSQWLYYWSADSSIHQAMQLFTESGFRAASPSSWFL